MLEKRNILITGASGKIGRTLTALFAGSGANLICHYHSNSGFSEKGNIATVKADLSMPENIASFLSSLPFVPEIYINCMGSYSTNSFAGCDSTKIMEDSNLNAFSPFIIAKELAKNTVLAHIIFFLDPRWNDILKERWSYGISQNMLAYLIRGLSLELAGKGIRANAVAPGRFNHKNSNESGPNLPYTFPINTETEASEIEEAVLFLINSKSTTGQILYLDGGRNLLNGVSYKRKQNGHSES